MANTMMALAGLPRNIEGMDDRELVALCDEPEFLLGCTPLERELIVRLGAMLETSQAEVDELQAEIVRLGEYEPTEVTQSRQRANRAALAAIIAEAERGPKAYVRVEC